MSKTLSKCFLVYYEHVFVTATFLLLQFLFQCFYCQFFEQISNLDLLLSGISFVLNPEEATEVFFIKGIL